MDEQQEQSLDDFFPIQETFSDFAGRQRQFRIELGAHPTGCFLRATEIRSPSASGGYSFAAYSPNDPFFALGQL
ncbi:MAG: hypothetical protein KDE34_22565 [Anaerolineales bacterium]|nr:hypothetical protein [Anaerolineales bacterium]